MDEQLNYAPSGFLSLSEDSVILSVNQTLCELLGYSSDQVIDQHVHTILPKSARIFYQLYFVPLVQIGKRVDELYISLEANNGTEIPVLVNAHKRVRDGRNVIDCIFIPIKKRNEYENVLLDTKKELETALLDKQKAVSDLQTALKSLEEKQKELLKLYEENQTFKIETKRELELARKIQKTALTDRILNEYIHIESHYKASNELSGDIYGIYQIDKYRYGIIILDVMGHGISSAMITMSLQSLFQRLISVDGNPQTVVKELDQYLHNLFQNSEQSMYYCTFIYLLIDTAAQKIDFINGGHPPAFLQDSTGIQEIHSSFPPIGTFEGIEFKTTSIPYQRGSRILLYTDGVTDPFGFNHLKPLLLDNKDIPLSNLKEKIIQSMDSTEFAYHESDDQCFLLIDLF
ncbi:phosphoserine phosphatase [Bacillus sp. UMB0899]|uniref:SpoIIE family protein phosphatase n=1 Tax=Metabacillus schmidteae TaxID=2730405 RepID=UPI000C804532|nr:SpoIIE family protein phosphatase [Metabacillus schmidteae]PMC38043.1 phosphoserine phosphatase [Bacillus sp. UMB0899]